MLASGPLPLSSIVFSSLQSSFFVLRVMVAKLPQNPQNSTARVIFFNILTSKQGAYQGIRSPPKLVGVLNLGLYRLRPCGQSYGLCGILVTKPSMVPTVQECMLFIVQSLMNSWSHPFSSTQDNHGMAKKWDAPIL